MGRRGHLQVVGEAFSKKVAFKQTFYAERADNVKVLKEEQV